MAEIQGKKVLIGMSGGVDSSAAAAILKEKGCEVCGCTVKMLETPSFSKNISDAKQVCEKLGIKHIILDLSKEFSALVMTPFAESYINGETPNPCIECNRHIKFGLMLKKAEELGFDLIATGHYADTAFDEKSGRVLLKRSADPKKDQSYVLYTLTHNQLAHTVFPLFGMTKAQVRELCVKYGLINADKPDSQDICFVPDGDYAAFIQRHSGHIPKEGDFIDSLGNVIGRHSGLINYTVGQRRGLGVTFGKPVFVSDKNAEKNTVTLSEKEELYKKTLYLRDVNLISVCSLEMPMEVTAKARYSAREQEAVIFPIENGIMKIEFKENVCAPAKGQACVFYDGDTVVGGGVITSAE